METIALPAKIDVHATAPNRAVIEVEPCYPGYGTTLGNALRRVLLSSLPGAAVTSVKINKVQHEFSTLPNVKEDIVDLLLNMKQLRIKLHEGDSAVLSLNVRGEKTATGADVTCPSNAEVMNRDLVLATLTDKSAELDIELTAETGRGYIPVEQQIREKPEIGVIAIDAIYSPVRSVNFDTENVRVGQMTNYDRLTLDITTDGTITPVQAYHQAAEILLRHFTFLHEADLPDVPAVATKKRSRKKKESPADPATASEPS